MSPLRLWKRFGEVGRILPSAEAGPSADLILPKVISRYLGGIIPFAMALADRSRSFWRSLVHHHRRQLILIWYRWRLICLVQLARLGAHYDLARRVLAASKVQLDAPLVALNI